MTTQRIIEHFVSEVKKSFSFLHEEHGFSEPEIMQKDGNGLLQINYIGSNVRIEVVLDLRDKIVDCYVAKLLDIKTHYYYNVDDSGRRVREELFNYLVKYHKFRGCVSKKPAGSSFEEAFSLDVEGFAQLLKKYVQEIINDNKLLFE